MVMDVLTFQISDFCFLLLADKKYSSNKVASAPSIRTTLSLFQLVLLNMLMEEEKREKDIFHPDFEKLLIE